jgi:hypothetical protein
MVGKVYHGTRRKGYKKAGTFNHFPHSRCYIAMTKKFVLLSLLVAASSATAQGPLLTRLRERLNGGNINNRPGRASLTQCRC